MTALPASARSSVLLEKYFFLFLSSLLSVVPVSLELYQESLTYSLSSATLWCGGRNENGPFCPFYSYNCMI